MPVDDVGNLEAGNADFADALELVTEVVALLAQLIVDVRKDAVALALADVERLAVARVNEPVDVGLELGTTSGGNTSAFAIDRERYPW